LLLKAREPFQVVVQLGRAIGGTADELFYEVARQAGPPASQSLRNCTISASSAASAASSAYPVADNSPLIGDGPSSRLSYGVPPSGAAVEDVQQAPGR
jgi:hypothetical protein